MGGANSFISVLVCVGRMGSPRISIQQTKITQKKSNLPSGKLEWDSVCRKCSRKAFFDSSSLTAAALPVTVSSATSMSMSTSVISPPGALPRLVMEDVLVERVVGGRGPDIGDAVPEAE
jgi:hypothetical protein